jgi:glycosyltransferase involved in cell wall biosynthesis
MIKLIIQIPCLNEEENIASTLKALPVKLRGVDAVEFLVIDDGCEDQTAKVALAAGAHHILRLNSHRGLGQAFAAGLREALRLGADIIVNTDADNQYVADDIQELIDPILNKSADLVIGARPINSIESFSRLKKILQKLGTWVVCRVSGISVLDATSGFRAISRSAAVKTHVFGRYTYVLETIIQAASKGIVVRSVPIRVNSQTRPSRLVRNTLDYVFRSAVAIVRVYFIYNPLRFFLYPAAMFFAAGTAIGFRYLYFLSRDDGAAHIQSLIMFATLLGIGFLLGLTALVCDLSSVNRRLLEKVESAQQLNQ